jgi:hypothetical protein
MRTPTAIVLAALLAPVVATTATAQTFNDVVVKKDGARVRGLEVVEFALSGIKAKKGSDTIEIPAHQVRAVEWSETPDAFVSARAAFDRGDFANAAQLFGEAIGQTDRALIKADARFFQIRAATAAIRADKGAAATAAGHANAWLAENATHWRVPEAMLLAGRALRLAGTTAEAATMLRNLDERATREALGPIWGARAKLELALTLLAEGKGGDARAAFQAASAAADSALTTPSPDDAELRTLKTTAKVGEGETFIAERDYAKAQNFFSALASGNQPGLVGAGFAGEGEAIYLAAAAANSVQDLRRAQLSLAQASVFDDQSGEASAKANFYLGKCLLALGQEREGDTFKARANAYFQIVTTSYGSSRWAALAKTELGR